MITLIALVWSLAVPGPIVCTNGIPPSCVVGDLGPQHPPRAVPRPAGPPDMPAPVFATALPFGLPDMPSPTFGGA